jgi:riboflavin kinase/FMN adenylyltransferase
VVYGRQLGRTLGTPTANLELHRLRAPLAGVYAVTVSGPGFENAHGVANVGTRPTVDDSIKANLEVHLLDWDKNLYGITIEVTFCTKLRDEQKFDSIEELKANINNDIVRAHDWFSQ